MGILNYWCQSWRLGTCTLLLLCLLLGAEAGSLTLTSHGQPAASIVIAQTPTRAAAFAAYELQALLQQLTGATLPIVADTPPPNGTVILVGESTLTQALGLSGNNFTSGQYLIRLANAQTLVLMGCDKRDTTAVNYANADTFPPYFDDQATCYAVYDFLESYGGMRFYWPTATCLDYTPTPSLTVIITSDTKRAPGFSTRWPAALYFPKDLAAASTTPPASLANAELLEKRETSLYWHRLRMGGQQFTPNHSFGLWNQYYSTHPTWYGVGYPAGTYAQPCMSNAEVKQHLIEAAIAYFDHGVVPADGVAFGNYFVIVPNDNGNWCKCPACQRRLHADTTGGHFSNNSASELLWPFINEVAAAVCATRPGKYIATLAYADYAYPPTNLPLHPQVAVMMCLHVRNWWSPKMAQNDKKILSLWATGQPQRPLYAWVYDNFPQEMAIGGNWYCFPAFQAHTFAQQIALFRQAGVRGVFMNGFGWGLYQGSYRYAVRQNNAVGLAEQADHYVFLKLLDNPNLNVDTLLREFFTRYYGQAGSTMQALYNALETTYTTSANYPAKIASGQTEAHQTEAIAWGSLGTEARMASFQTLVAQAQAQAATDTPLKQQRLALFTRGVWDYMVAGRNLYLQHTSASQPPAELWANKLVTSANGDPTSAHITYAAAGQDAYFYTMGRERATRPLTVSVAHDAQYLYIKFDEQLNPNTLVNAHDLASGDCWELYLARRRSGPYQRLVFAPQGDFLTFQYGVENQYSRLVPARVVSDTTSTTHWTVSVAIPLRQFLLDGDLKTGWVVYMNALRCTANKEIYALRAAPQGLRDTGNLMPLWLDN